MKNLLKQLEISKEVFCLSNLKCGSLARSSTLSFNKNWPDFESNRKNAENVAVCHRNIGKDETVFAFKKFVAATEGTDSQIFRSARQFIYNP